MTKKKKKKVFDKEFLKFLEKQQKEDFDKNLAEAVLSVAWYYRIDVDRVLIMPYPKFHLMQLNITVFERYKSIMRAKQISKLFPGKKGGTSTMG